MNRKQQGKKIKTKTKGYYTGGIWDPLCDANSASIDRHPVTHGPPTPAHVYLSGLADIRHVLVPAGPLSTGTAGRPHPSPTHPLPITPAKPPLLPVHHWPLWGQRPTPGLLKY